MQNVSNVDETLHRQLGLESPCFSAQLLPQLMDLVRASRRLPLGEEHAIRRGSKEFLSASRELGNRSMTTALRTLRFVDPATHSASTEGDLGNFNLVIDSIDMVLEKVDSCLKEALAVADGTASQASQEQEEEAASNSVGAASGSTSGSRLPSIPSKIPKPQVRWRHLIDNERTEFVSRLIEKHNAKASLPSRLLEAQKKAGMRKGGAQSTGAAAMDDVPTALQKHLGALGVSGGSTGSGLPHPYEEEIRMLSWPDTMMKPRAVQRYGRMEDTPLTWVRTADELRTMIGEIKATCAGKEVAIDVEHHDFRSYRGFCCLVQVSTRQKDFLVDPFDIFAEMHLLNEITTDPDIVKVLHGADRDVIWLQRDFSIYFVNMFDTGQATRVLKFQGGFSLANLVRHYCSVKLDKQYQTADWRERPLSNEMAHYARLDTHFLLYIYDMLWNALLLQQTAGASSEDVASLQPTEQGVQAARLVLEKSAELCRSLYIESPFDAANAAMQQCERFGMKQKPLESRQFSALQGLLAWRDRLARTLDESWNLIAPDACLWRVALALPTSASRLRSTCNPLPLTLQSRAQEVVDIINKCEDAAGAAAALAAASPAFKVAKPPRFPERQSATSSTNGSAATPKTVRNWPVRTPSSLKPVVHVRTTGGSDNGTAQGPTLALMFDEESEGEDYVEDLDAKQDVAQADKQADKAHEISTGFSLAAAAPAPPPQAAASTTEKTDAAPAKPASKPQESQPTVALREAYNLPKTGKKKKKKAGGAADEVAKGKSLSSQVASMGAAAAAVGKTSFESEAAAFRGALQGVTTSATTASPAAPKAPAAANPAGAPPLKKRKKAVGAAAATAVAAKPAEDAPKAEPAAVAPTVAATQASMPGGAAAAPKKKKKRKLAPAEQNVQEPEDAVGDVAATDPYAADDPYL